MLNQDLGTGPLHQTLWFTEGGAEEKRNVRRATQPEEEERRAGTRKDLSTGSESLGRWRRSAARPRKKAGPGDAAEDGERDPTRGQSSCRLGRLGCDDSWGAGDPGEVNGGRRGRQARHPGDLL